MATGTPSELPLSTLSVDLGHTLAGLAIGFLVLSTTIFTARIYARLRPTLQIGLDDWVACFAYVFTVTDAANAISSVRIMVFKSPQFIPVTELPYIGKLVMAGSITGAWSLAAIKTSVACTLLRFSRTHPSRRWFLYIMIALQIVTAIFNTIMQATRFIPTSASWSADVAFRDKAKVWSDHAFRVGITASSSSNVATDVLFSLFPIVFLREIRRPLGEKVLIGCLMGLGLFASTASIIKIVKIRNFGSTSDIFAEGQSIGIWSILEEQLGFFAACAPCLKALVQRGFTQFGWIKTPWRQQNRFSFSFSLRQDKSQVSAALEDPSLRFTSKGSDGEKHSVSTKSNEVSEKV